jgi:hypothetical protein
MIEKRKNTPNRKTFAAILSLPLPTLSFDSLHLKARFIILCSQISNHFLPISITNTEIVVRLDLSFSSTGVSFHGFGVFLGIKKQITIPLAPIGVLCMRTGDTTFSPPSTPAKKLNFIS